MCGGNKMKIEVRKIPVDPSINHLYSFAGASQEVLYVVKIDEEQEWTCRGFNHLVSFILDHLGRIM
jgi:hypothetical protein